MKKELHIQSIENPSKEIYGKSDFYHLHEVDGYKYTRLAVVEVLKSNQDGEVYTYINGKQSEFSFREYLNELSKNYTVNLDNLDEKIYRKHLPDEVTYYDNGNPKYERWLEDGQLHREDGPARINYFENGTVKSECWVTYGCTHREDGPAKINYFENGTVKSEKWLLNFDVHRSDEPALIIYCEDGALQSEKWYINDDLHREDGPAEIYYDEKGNTEVEAYHINGKELSKSDFEKVTKEIKQTEISSPDKSTDKPKHKGPSL